MTTIWNVADGINFDVDVTGLIATHNTTTFGGGDGIRATTSYSSGKYVFEVDYPGAESGAVTIGLSKAGAILKQGGATADPVGYEYAFLVAGNGAFAVISSDDENKAFDGSGSPTLPENAPYTLRVYVDFDNKLLYVEIDTGSGFVKLFGSDASTLTGGVDLSADMSGAYYISANATYDSTNGQFNLNPTPTGIYSGWSTWDAAAGAVAYLRPSSDVSDGSWVDQSGGTSLYAAIDETSLDDADFIKSSTNPSNDVCTIALSDPSGTPGEPMKIRYRYWRVGGEGSMELRVRLMQGASQIASWTHSAISTSAVTAEQTLSGGEFASISDFTDLRLEFRANKT